MPKNIKLPSWMAKEPHITQKGEAVRDWSSRQLMRDHLRAVLKAK